MCMHMFSVQLYKQASQSFIYINDCCFTIYKLLKESQLINISALKDEWLMISTFRYKAYL